MCLAILSFIIAAYIYSNNSQENKQSAKVVTKSLKVGTTGNCRKVPKFISTLNMKRPALDSTQEGGLMGFQIRDYDPKKNGKASTWRDQSWNQTGYIGGFERDEKGNIYVFPMPYVSLLKNTPQTQNRIYKIDAKTAEMSLFMELPTKELPNSRNPFGVMGMYYDCDTHSLYVSSLAGSKPMKESGRIYQIDLMKKEIQSTLEQVDVIGLGTFNTVNGKKLYFGSARNPYIYSINLDEKGRFIGKKQYEFSLSSIKGGDTTVAKKITFKRIKNKFYLVVKNIEFGFRLIAENNPFKKLFIFEYDEPQNKWTFKGTEKE